MTSWCAHKALACRAVHRRQHFYQVFIKSCHHSHVHSHVALTWQPINCWAKLEIVLMQGWSHCTDQTTLIHCKNNAALEQGQLHMVQEAWHIHVGLQCMISQRCLVRTNSDCLIRPFFNSLWNGQRCNLRAGSFRSLSPCCPACVGGHLRWRPSPVAPAHALSSLSLGPPDTGLGRQMHTGMPSLLICELTADVFVHFTKENEMYSNQVLPWAGWLLSQVSSPC